MGERDAAANVAAARAMTSLETYEQMIRIYRERPLADRHRLWFETLIRQRDLKRKGL